MRIHALAARPPAGLADALECFERDFSYPLGTDRRFRISHGEDYSRFVRPCPSRERTGCSPRRERCESGGPYRGGRKSRARSTPGRRRARLEVLPRARGSSSLEAPVQSSIEEASVAPVKLMRSFGFPAELRAQRRNIEARIQ